MCIYIIYIYIYAYFNSCAYTQSGLTGNGGPQSGNNGIPKRPLNREFFHIYTYSSRFVLKIKSVLAFLAFLCHCRFTWLCSITRRCVFAHSMWAPITRGTQGNFSTHWAISCLCWLQPQMSSFCRRSVERTLNGSIFSAIAVSHGIHHPPPPSTTPPPPSPHPTPPPSLHTHPPHHHSPLFTNTHQHHLTSLTRIQHPPATTTHRHAPPNHHHPTTTTPPPTKAQHPPPPTHQHHETPPHPKPPFTTTHPSI